MKITKAQLRKIIKEEVQETLLAESGEIYEGGPPYDVRKDLGYAVARRMNQEEYTAYRNYGKVPQWVEDMDTPYDRSKVAAANRRAGIERYSGIRQSTGTRGYGRGRYEESMDPQIRQAIREELQALLSADKDQ